jgi:hypothetical protein
MPKQIQSNYTEVRIPFQSMSFTPDVPSTALGPNEYNSGQNVETDVRGIRSMAGDQQILESLPAGSGAPTFITGNFRADGYFWFVVATQAVPGQDGQYFAFNPVTQVWDDITPTDPTFDSSGYNQATNITEAWNGNVLFLNDEQNPPMFWPDAPGSPLVSYSNQVPLDIDNITLVTAGTRLVTFTDTQAVAPFAVGSYVQITDVLPRYYNGTWLVTACTVDDVTIQCTISDPYSSGGTVAPAYTWNYNPNWSSVYAKFMRLYNTPNVGSILVAGNLTATNASTSATEIYPVTVQWSQAFGLNQAPTTWTPTVTNVANQLEVPLRGPALDAFPCNGQFFLCSFWDTVVFSPINYATTSAPILGVRQYNQGRGILSSNCWANTDKLVYGVDARDIWVFDGQDFKGLGNQRVKNWFYDQLDPENYDRVFMEVNSQRSQVEIYYPDSDAVNGVPNKMLSYRYDLDCWNAPRDVSSATFSCESPVWNYDDTLNEWVALNSSRTVVYAQGVAESQPIQKDQGFEFIDGAPIVSKFRRDNIKLSPKYSTKLMVHRILPEVVNLGAIYNQSNEIPLYPSTGNVTVTIEGANSVGSEPSYVVPTTIAIDANGNNNNNPWVQIDQNAYRVNSIEIGDSSNSHVWMCSATTWQVTETEDDR